MVAELAPLLLLVDDDRNDEELARIALEEAQVPHRLVIARDGAEALDYLNGIGDSTDSSWPELILLDLKLPKVSGLEVLERLRSDSKARATPIVVFTSSNETRDLTRSYDLGANAYIRKPINFAEYRETMLDITRFWMLRNSSPPRLSRIV